MTLTPAYGRDYHRAKDAIKDYKAGKDFIVNDITSKWNGKYCSCRDFPNELVQLRFNNLRDTTFSLARGDSKC